MSSPEIFLIFFNICAEIFENRYGSNLSFNNSGLKLIIVVL